MSFLKPGCYQKKRIRLLREESLGLVTAFVAVCVCVKVYHVCPEHPTGPLNQATSGKKTGQGKTDDL